MEIITPEMYQEYEAFVSSHPQSAFTQSVNWQKVKAGWQWEGIISRDDEGNIAGAMGVLIQRIPIVGSSFLYSPRGPVCDLGDGKVLADLFRGADVLAGKYRAHEFKCDPDIADSAELIEKMKGFGFERFYGPEGFETIQARFNYRLYINGRSEEELLASFTQKCRYNIRVAKKNGVEVRTVGPEYLPDFSRIMKTTGERDGFNTRPQSYFERMLSALGENVRLYMAFYNGIPIAGAIATNFAGKVCYVYGASDNVYRNVMPNYLVQWEMIRWAVETGCFLYDFQGVSGILDESNHYYGLYRFKKGFNGVLEELPGEFSKTYRPLAKKLTGVALAANAKRMKIKKALKRG